MMSAKPLTPSVAERPEGAERSRGASCCRALGPSTSAPLRGAYARAERFPAFRLFFNDLAAAESYARRLRSALRIRVGRYAASAPLRVNGRALVERLGCGQSPRLRREPPNSRMHPC